MKSYSTKTSVAELLRNPGVFIEHARDDANPGGLIAFLLALAIAGTAAFGFAIGSFVGWDVALVDAAKMVGITLFSFALCCPTLYVFASLGGCRLSMARLVAVGLAPMAVLGCLLAALSPIMWLFSVSTESVGFIVFFSCALTAVAAYLAQRPMLLVLEKRIVGSLIGMRIWFFVLLIVVLQAVTLVRPMLAPLGAERHPQGKCFFLEHFSRTIIDRH